MRERRGVAKVPVSIFVVWSDQTPFSFSMYTAGTVDRISNTAQISTVRLGQQHAEALVRV